MIDLNLTTGKMVTRSERIIRPMKAMMVNVVKPTGDTGLSRWIIHSHTEQEDFTPETRKGKKVQIKPGHEGIYKFHCKIKCIKMH